MLGLFAGLEGWEYPFRQAGHDVFSVDMDMRFDVDLHADVLDLVPEHFPWRPDLILASPPCEAFSVLQIGRNWTGPDDYPPHQPKTEKARLGLALVQHTLWLIGQTMPAFWIIENPRAKLRKLPVVGGLERRTVTYCQYGAATQKPTDLWGGFPPSLRLRPMCEPMAPCHIAAPAGSRTGIQGGGGGNSRTRAAERAKVPLLLAQAVMNAAERDLAAGDFYVPDQPGLWEVTP